MPSGLSDAKVQAILAKVLGASADTSILGTTIYLDLLTTAPDDDNGTGAVSWGQGRHAVTVASGANWPAPSGRMVTSGTFTMPANASGSDIVIEALAWYSASTAGTYLGGGPVPYGTETIPAGAVPQVTATLASPSPS